jgi:hypothetical protein
MRPADRLMLSNAQWNTLRLRLIKIAACVIGTTSRVRIAFATAHPETAFLAILARCLQLTGP